MTARDGAMEIIRRFDRADIRSFSDFASEFHVFFREAQMSKEDAELFGKLADICDRYSPFEEDRLKWKGFTDESQLLSALREVMESEETEKRTGTN